MSIRVTACHLSPAILLLLAAGCADDKVGSDDTAGDEWADYPAAGDPPDITREECREALGALGVSFSEFDQDEIAAGVTLDDLGQGIDLFYTGSQEATEDGVLRTACPTAISLAGAAQSLASCGVDLWSVGHVGSINDRAVRGTDTPSAHTWGAAVDIGALAIGDDVYWLIDSYDRSAGQYTVDEMGLFNDAINGAFDDVIGPEYNSDHWDHWHAENTLAWSGEAATSISCPGESPASLTVTYPDGGESFEIGETVTLTWESTNTSGTVHIEFFRGPNLDGTDESIALVGGTEPDNGSYGPVTFYDDAFEEGGDDYYLCIWDSDGSPSDCGGHFSIAGGTSYPDDDSDGYASDVDCDDQDSSVHPGATERCNAEDDDCDGSADDGVSYTYYYRDSDSDGYGSGAGTYECDAPSGYVSNDDDCDDSDREVHPGAAEECDSEDDDCDGSIDEGVSYSYYYRDSDSDGYGSGSGTYDCAAPSGYVSNSDDCDDGDSGVNPGASESCDGEDENCDGIIDDDSTCWVTIYRFEDSATGARCWNTSTSPPSTCSSYTLEIEAWIVPDSGVPNTFHAVQCSNGTDHIIVEDGSADETSLRSDGYDCSVSLGYPYELGAGPADGTTPWSDTCDVWRFSYSTSDGGAHLFTRGADSVSGMTCEDPARFEVVTNESCFAGTPSGC